MKQRHDSSATLGAPSCVVTGVCVAVFAALAPAQVHRPLERAPAGDQLGTSVARLGDVNGDGTCDLIAGALRSVVGGPGYAVVISGANGQILRTLYGESNHDQFGIAVAGEGRVDGDSVPDIAVGAINWRKRVDEQRPGFVRVYSGATGEILLQLAAPDTSELFGQSVEFLSDIDGDGHDEIVVAAPALDLFGNGVVGQVFVFSGANGELLYRVSGERRKDEFGTRLATTGDLDGDGLRDLLVGAPGRGDAEVDTAGYVRAVSGKTGETVFTVRGTSPRECFGAGLAAGVDLDGDGALDFAVTSSTHDLLPSDGLRFFSGASHARIGNVVAASAEFRPGPGLALTNLASSTAPCAVMSDSHAASSALRIASFDGRTTTLDLSLSRPQGGLVLCRLTDLDHDGSEDFAVGCPWAEGGGDSAGAAVGEVLVVSAGKGRVLFRVRGDSTGR